MLVDGYEMEGWFVRDATPEDGAAALRAAGITPEEFNAPAESGQYGLAPKSRFFFWRESEGGALKAGRN